MAKQVWQCEGCPKTYGTRNEADYCNAEHSLEGLADLMHDKLCRLSHADGCSYLYENWENRRETRNRWLQKASELNKFSDQCNVSPSSLLEFVVKIRG